ncbi:MAG: hypothetical protein PHF23_03545 [Smithellaceae bacterium]|nr:hypothetical protein [Smithellaceae bacterium]
MAKKIIVFIFAMLIFYSLPAFAATPADQKGTHTPSEGAAALKPMHPEERYPVLAIIPGEVDLGLIKPGSTAFREFKLSGISPGTLECAAACPDNWEVLSGQALPMTLSREPVSLRVELMIDEDFEKSYGVESTDSAFAARMKMEVAGKDLICRKSLKAGQYRKALPLTFAGGSRFVFIDFRIQPAQIMPLISFFPQRLDFGSQPPGKILSQKIELTNKGREKLHWSVVVPFGAGKSEAPGEAKQERYFSFRQEELPEPGKYLIPEHLKDSTELIGRWTEKNGYPLSSGGAGAMKFRFQGTGVSVFLESHAPEGNCAVYLDEVPLILPDELSGQWEKKEILVAEGLADGPHTLKLVVKRGVLELEGVKVFGREIQRGPKGWIAVFPNSGTTLSEIDYLNVRVDTTSLVPGVYGEDILFQTNTGEEAAEVYIGIVPDAGHKGMDVYLYSRGADYLYTSDPQAEARLLDQNRYIKEGIAFRLFAPQTPGTIPFHRWHNPVIRDHFYSHDRSGGNKRLDGYIYEGNIGNIATSRMTNTRELYRWHNPTTGRHYYSTQPKLLPALKRGYRFDGIAGYVR